MLSEEKMDIRGFHWIATIYCIVSSLSLVLFPNFYKQAHSFCIYFIVISLSILFFQTTSNFCIHTKQENGGLHVNGCSSLILNVKSVFLA